MKRILIVSKMIFLSLSLASCATLPPFPSVNQCAYSVKFNKFRCCNTETKKCFNLKREDPIMEAAQCLNADDYKKAEEWTQTVIDIAKARCK